MHLSFSVSPSLAVILAGGADLNEPRSDFRTNTELVMAVPCSFVARHWYAPEGGGRGKVGKGDITGPRRHVLDAATLLSEKIRRRKHQHLII